MAKSFIPSKWFKVAGVLAGGTLLCAALFAASIDLWAKHKLSFIESALSATLKRPVTVQSAHYGLFGGFMLNGVEIRQLPPFSRVRAERLSLMPSFRLFPPSIAVRRVVISRPEIVYYSLPGQNVDARAVLDGLSRECGRIGFVRLRTDIRSFEIREAFLKMDGVELEKWPNGVGFAVSGRRRTDRFELKASAQYGPIKMKGGGDARLFGDGHWQLSLASEKVGLEKFKPYSSWLVPESGSMQLFAGWRGYRDVVQPTFELRVHNAELHDAQKKLTIGSLGGQLRLGDGALELRECSAFVNGVPVRVDVRKSSGRRERFVMDVSTYPGQSRAMKGTHGMNGSFRVSAVRSKDGWGGYLRFRREDLRVPKKREDVWTVSFRALEAAECRFLLVRRNDGSDAQNFDLSLRDLSLFLMANERFAQAEIVDRSLKQGKMNLRAQLRYPALTWKATLFLKDVDAQEWLRAIQHELPVTGRLSGSASWGGVKTAAKGQVRLHLSDGRIGPDRRLERWANDTGIEVLRDIRFKSIDAEMTHTGGVWEVQKFDLSGEALKLSGYFKAVKDRVSGQCAVRFPVTSIRDSSELKWLLKFVGAGDWVDFDFKIAGHAASPRVYWLGGEFKKKLETKLLPWMRYEFSRQLEKRFTSSPVYGSSQA